MLRSRFAHAHRQRLVVITLLVAAVGAATWQPRLQRQQHPPLLRIATWNMEWLVTPQTAHRDRLACRAGLRADLPCDIARRNTRSSADFAKLRYYVRKLNADVIAFQEVESAAIAANIFRGYDICITQGRGLQQLGFAVRRTLPHRCGTPLAALALGNARLRPGMALHLDPGTAHELLLLTVHLKSGCAHMPLTSHNASCVTLGRQVALLSGWMHQAQMTAQNVIVLGDFNRQPADSASDRPDEFWDSLLAAYDTTPTYRRVGASTEFHNCYVGQGYSSFIDHILVSQTATLQLANDSVHRLPYHTRDATRYRLSDHCPLTVALRWRPPSNAKGLLN
jgi:endonuclease/exonuclease/phosphatase family metal-dependent hydrolase